MGQTISFTAQLPETVSAGQIVFCDGNVTLWTEPVVGNSATFNVSYLALGSHTITAAFVDSRGVIGTASAAAVVNVTQTTPTLTLAVLESDPGISPILTIGFKGPVDPKETVDIKDGSTLLGSYGASASPSTIVVLSSPLSLGKHVLMAYYAGDSNLFAGGFSPVAVDVEKLATQVVLGAGIIPRAGTRAR